MFNLDEDKLSLAELDKMKQMAFPLIEGLEFLDMCKPYDPATLGDSTAENVDTGSLEVELNKSELLMEEIEFKEIKEEVSKFTAKYNQQDEEVISSEEYIKARKELDEKEQLAVSKLVFKGYSRPWVEAHLYSSDEGFITVSNDSFSPLHIFRMRSASTLEDEANADSLLEAGIDLLCCEVRQRSWINDMRDKLVSPLS